MRGYVDNRSYAFITAYLLGVEHKVLKRDYIENYVYSEGLEQFNQIENAQIVRALSRVKQIIFRNYENFKDTTDLNESARGYIDYDLAFLQDEGIDLYPRFTEAGCISEFLNIVQGEINNRILGVLEAFKYSHIEQIEALFYLYELTKKTLNRLMSKVQANEKKFPHGIVIVKGTRALQHLPFILQNDRKLFLSSYAITNTPYNVNTIEIPQFDWSILGSTSNTPTIPINQGSNIYVDCDNMDFFMFISLMESLENSLRGNQQHVIKMYLDDKSSPIWQYADKVVKPDPTKIRFENINVKRVKDEKSVVDVVIASHMTRDSIIDKKPLGLISSDSDFFGLTETGLEFFVLYDASCTSREYINYLNRKKMLNFDISTLTSTESKLESRDIILTYLCLSYLPTMPIHEWTSENLVEKINSSFDEDLGYGMELLGDELTILTKLVLNDLKVTTGEKALKLQSKGVELEVDLQSRAS